MDMKKYIDEYVNWIKSEISFVKIGEYYEITTPYLDSCNDYLQIYVKQDNDTIFFSDDSAILNNLKMRGLQLTPSRKKQLNNILLQFGVILDGTELTLKSSIKEFPFKKHMFVQAMLRISDLYMTSKASTASYFLDDIQNFFNEKEIFCTENAQFIGKSGFTHNYDFVFQRTKNLPERLCLAINNPNKNTVGNALFSWDDTRQTRKSDSCLLVILNDSSPIQRGIEDAFINYNAKTIKWSERFDPDNLKLLSA